MSSSNDMQTTHDQIPGEPKQRRGGRSSAASFGLRAAILAGLVVATVGGGVATQGISDDPVRMVSGGPGGGSTCCPPNL